MKKITATDSNPNPLYVSLTNVGNPDHGQNPDRPLPGVRNNKAKLINGIVGAVDACRSYITDNDLGMGNWTGGQVYDATTLEQIAYVSYNGRVWKPSSDWRNREPYEAPATVAA